MSIRSATPYLFLDGRAGEAIQAYARALGAELTSIQRFGEVAKLPGGHARPASVGCSTARFDTRRAPAGASWSDHLRDYGVGEVAW